MMEGSVDEIVTESSTEIKNIEDEEGRSRIFKEVKNILQNDGEVTILVIRKLKGIILSTRESEQNKLQLSDENFGVGAVGGGIGLTSDNVKKEHDWMIAGNLTEEEKRQINEQWFKIMKRILENLPLAISEIEMEELIDILSEKERACEQDAEWVKQMDTEAGQVPLPSLPDLVLEKIFSCSSLSTKDILSSRLVCHHWWALATKELRKRICKKFIAISTYNYHSGSDSDSDTGILKEKQKQRNDFQEFLEVMKKSQLLPISAFHINWEYIKGIDDCDEMRNFFQTFAPTFTHLRLDFDPDHYVQAVDGFKKYLEGIQLKKLEELSLDLGGEYDSCSWTECIRIPLVSPCFSSTQKLKKLKFLSIISMPVLVKSLQKFPLPHLNNLSLSVHNSLEDKELESLGLLVNLKRLSLKIHGIRLKPETMKKFLESQSKTLEYLKLIDPYPYDKKPEHVYEYPVMECLKGFYFGNSSTNISFSSIYWNKSFPKLQELKIRNGFGEYLLLAGRESKHFGLKLIDFSRGIEQRLYNCLPGIGQMFPNVHTVKISPNNLLDPIFSNNFPNLKEIIMCWPVHNVVRNREESRNRLKKFVWDMKLKSRPRGLAAVKDYLTRLTEIGVEIKEDVRYEGRSRVTYDCTESILGLLHGRIELEQLDEELKAEMEMKKRIADLNLKSATIN